MCGAADKSGDKTQAGDEAQRPGDKLGRREVLVDSFSTDLPHAIHGLIHRLSTAYLWTKTECLLKIRICITKRAHELALANS